MERASFFRPRRKGLCETGTRCEETAVNQFVYHNWRQAPLSSGISHLRGEGIFLRLKEEALQSWESIKEVQELRLNFLESHKLWRAKLFGLPNLTGPAGSMGE
jgi:hypothetical protein